jgi:hypothetical protein
MTPRNIVSVSVAIRFVVFIGLGDVALLYYAAKRSGISSRQRAQRRKVQPLRQTWERGGGWSFRLEFQARANARLKQVRQEVRCRLR